MPSIRRHRARTPGVRALALLWGRRLAPALALAAACRSCPPAAAAPTRQAEACLAVVDGDTIDTADLRFELDLMDKLRQDLPQAAAPKAEDVLRRLIQNRLLLHEGLRMGMDENFAVTNQVKELVRAKSMSALLDSVALSVPAQTPDLVAARAAKVKEFVGGLYRTYGVVVDSVLLKSLDFGSADPQVAAELRESEAVLATVPTGQLKVKGLAKVLRFKAFHGLAGRPDAAQQRDRYFREWVDEALLTHEARRLGFADAPAVREMADRLQENLIREQTIDALLNEPFAPGDDQVEAFYRDHLQEVTAPPRVRMESVKLGGEEAAADLRARWLQGAKLDWLRKNVPGVIEGEPPFPAEWIEPQMIALPLDGLAVGLIPEPYGVPGGWVVARVAEVSAGEPLPLSECRDRILSLMKADFLRSLMTDITARLEAAADIRLQPDAARRAAQIIDERAGADQ